MGAVRAFLALPAKEAVAEITSLVKSGDYEFLIDALGYLNKNPRSSLIIVLGMCYEQLWKEHAVKIANCARRATEAAKAGDPEKESSHRKEQALWKKRMNNLGQKVVLERLDQKYSDLAKTYENFSREQKKGVWADKDLNKIPQTRGAGY